MRLRRWVAARLEKERGLPVRLTIASITVVVVTIPFMLLLVVAKLPLNRLDSRVAHELHAYALANPVMTDLLIVWTDVFGPWPWRAVVLVLAFWLWRSRREGAALWAATTIIVGGVLGWLLKIVVDRARPSLPDPVALAPGESFPSGHALHVTLGAGIVLLLALPHLPVWGRVAAWAGAIFMIVSVAYTRVALGVHWVSDVLGGVMLGVAVLAATVAAFESWRRQQGRRRASPPLEGVEPEAVRAGRDR
ncbi:phosphatase PAP2 family protein [Nonomuraea sp. NPDC048826]|uniref:phosphatase PAP2 family protein n=1 Tax=Nonomuraea sp. NPDC048826 TaxID=3364347 RepID=UPI003723A77D